MFRDPVEQRVYGFLLGKLVFVKFLKWKYYLKKGFAQRMKGRNHSYYFTVMMMVIITYE